MSRSSLRAVALVLSLGIFLGSSLPVWADDPDPTAVISTETSELAEVAPIEAEVVDDAEVGALAAPFDWGWNFDHGNGFDPLVPGGVGSYWMPLNTPGEPSAAVLQISVEAPMFFESLEINGQWVSCIPSARPEFVDCAFITSTNETVVKLNVRTPVDTPVGRRIEFTLAVVPGDSTGDDPTNNTLRYYFTVAGYGYDWSWYISELSNNYPIVRGSGAGYFSAQLEGPRQATPVTLHITVDEPSTLAWVKLNDSYLDCPPTGPGSYDCSFVTDPSRGSWLIFGVASPDDLPLGSEVGLTVTAEVAGATGDTLENNTFSHTFAVVGTADLTYEATPESETIFVGQQLEMQFTITNNGPDAATNVSGGISLHSDPTGVLTVVKVGPGGEMLSTEGRVWGAEWFIDEIPVGESRTFSFTVMAVKESFDGQALVKISAGADQANPPDNIADSYGTLIYVIPASASSTSVSSPGSTPADPTTTAPPKVKGPQLAATGQAVGGLIGWAALTVLVGAGFLIGARRKA